MSIKQPGKPKAFNDPIHGLIQLDWVYVRIIDTTEFQRLRNIKQLGTAHLVYPSAIHTRFEHSIGTCHLALKLVHHLQKDESLKISKKDQLCVGLAALLHDIGHGPFSHLFEKIVKTGVLGKDIARTWKHELASIKIFDLMIKKYKLLEHFSSCGYTRDNEMTMDEIHLVKEMIFGPLEKSSTGSNSYKKATKYQSPLPADKYFLYEIVSNHTSGVDVDKWEYFARDCYHLGIANNFSYDRFIEFSKALVTDKKSGKRQICLRDKEDHNVYEMFHTRYRLYRQAYYHAVTLGTEAMITDIIAAAADHFEVRPGKPGANPESYRIKSAFDDMETYLLLDDTILQLICHDAQRNPNLESAVQLYNRLLERDIYKVMKKIVIPANRNIPDKLVKYNYGKKEENPVDNVYFYSKDNEKEPFTTTREKVSHLLPYTFEERHLLIFVKERDDKIIAEARQCIDSWHTAKFQDWLCQFAEKNDKGTQTELLQDQ
ncbi:deoxynucleoside triphosphate triphosphohydrolase SAMHD1-like isoform X2 [Ptychodera flava]|uniref:deoxynucleoside triphosphate triphosphohydrolase SAMHD1-like isoform X2 n=1 Tax=Ptychodera flava TaxID=63121 RepID=UPI00396A185E